MKFILLHGRHDPDQEMDNWGYNGPELLGVRYLHSVYGNLTIGFENEGQAMVAHEATGWPYFDRAVLEVPFFEDLVLCRNGAGDHQYYGDWELQADD